jgi:oligoribonuclease NrnB/cAMP/cGMP phosphodiesterase (DHH superfamily)
MTYEICFYHDDSDGRTCAAICKHANKNKTIVCVPVNFGFEDNVIKKYIMDLINITIDKIYIFDYTFTPKNMAYLYDVVHKDNTRLIWCDHHITAKDNNLILWNSEISGLRDIKCAGCELVWNYYFKNIDMPKLVQLIADRDMWRFKHKDTNAFYEITKDFTENAVDTFSKILNNIPHTDDYMNSLIEDGYVLLDAKQVRIERNFKTGTDVIIRVNDVEYNTRMINSSEDISDLGKYCYNIGYDIAFIWRYKNDKVIVSLRSNNNINNVEKIAKLFDVNGGGHVLAAGFETDLLVINDLLKTKCKMFKI